MKEKEEKSVRGAAVLQDLSKAVKAGSAKIERVVSSLFKSPDAPGRIVLFLLPGVCAFLLSRGEALFGTYPLGIAYLCATGQGLPMAWLGCTAGAVVLGEKGVPYLVLYALLFALRLYLDDLARRQDRVTGATSSAGMRAAISAAGACALGVYFCARESFSIHALMALLFSTAVSGAGAFLFAGNDLEKGLHPLIRKLCKGAFLFALVFSARGLSFLSFSPAAALASFLLLLQAEKDDLLFSVLSGAAMGVACGGEYPIVFALYGAAAGALHKHTEKAFAWLGILAGFSFSFFRRGGSAFLYVLPDLVCGALCFLPVSAYRAGKGPFSALKRPPVPAKKPETGPEDPLEASLLSLSEELSEFSRQMRQPDLDGALRVVDDTAAGVCRDCKKRCLYPGQQKAALAKTLFEAGNLDVSAPEAAFLSSCPGKESFRRTLDERYAEYLRRLHAGDRAGGWADCCKSLRDLKIDQKRREQEEKQTESEEKRAFTEALRRYSIDFERVEAPGARPGVLRAVGVSPGQIRMSAPSLTRAMEKACDLSLSLPELEYENERADLVFRRRERLKVSHACVVSQKEGETFCGDATACFQYDHYFYFLLCDGMGSGREASLVSELSLRFSERFFACGASPETTLLALNDLLLGQECERSVTADLLCVDLYDGKSVSFKCGACPSLVLRGGNLFKLPGASVPLGATRQPDLVPSPLRLKAGDRLLFFSDGVSAEPEKTRWLQELLSGKLPENAERLARAILAEAKKAGALPDDRTVAVLDVLPSDGVYE